MWAFLVLVFALAAGAPETNDTAAERKPAVARGKLLAPGVVGHNLEYDSSEEKNPRLIFYDDKDEVVQTVPVKKMKADEISSLLDSLGFYKRSQKGEEVPEEFQNFPLHAPRDEL